MEDRLREIRERLERVYGLDAMKHYSLESGCDAFIEWRNKVRTLVNVDMDYLLSELTLRDEMLEVAEDTLGFYSDETKYLPPTEARFPFQIIDLDGGCKAREALAKLKAMREGKHE